MSGHSRWRNELSCRSNNLGPQEQAWEDLSPNALEKTIYTFLEPVKGEAPGDIVKFWQEAWEASGFTPKILSLQDAQRHPLYQDMEANLTIMGKAGVLGPNADYDRLCYLRYLAMAAVGGGWMSDFDAIPLDMHRAVGLPRGGRFTVFEDHVPSLISGSAAEYTRIGLELIQEAMTRLGDGKLFSDMFGLAALLQRNVFSPVEREVTGLDATTGSELLRADGCEITKGKFAVHVSHAMVHHAKRNMSERAALARELRSIWVRCCQAARANKQTAVLNSPAAAPDARVVPASKDFAASTAPASKHVLACSKGRKGRPSAAGEANSNEKTIHTFWEPLSRTDDGMLQLWQQAWAAAGFTPRILGLKDAQRHTLFQEAANNLTKMAQAGLLTGKTGYDYLSYLRYLAMSAVGGGWMTDYDTLPLRMPESLRLPRGGKFTAFENHVPSLVSGSADEFLRVGHELILEGMKRLGSGNQWTDMNGLEALLQRGLVAPMQPQVTGLDGEVGSELLRADACARTRFKFAVHVSGTMVRFAKRPLEEKAKLALEMHTTWMQKCCDVESTRDSPSPQNSR